MICPNVLHHVNKSITLFLNRKLSDLTMPPTRQDLTQGLLCSGSLGEPRFLPTMVIGSQGAM